MKIVCREDYTTIEIYTEEPHIGNSVCLDVSPSDCGGVVYSSMTPADAIALGRELIRLGELHTKALETPSDFVETDCGSDGVALSCRHCGAVKSRIKEHCT